MTDPTPDDIDEVVEVINTRLPWTVTDWSHSSGRYEEPSLTIKLEWSPLDALEDGVEIRADVLNLIEYIDDGEGAPTEVVVEDAVLNQDGEVTEAQVREVISELKQQGEVYEPRTDHLRTTR